MTQTVPINYNNAEKRKVVVMAVSHRYLCYFCSKTFSKDEVEDIDHPKHDGYLVHICQKCKIDI